MTEMQHESEQKHRSRLVLGNRDCDLDETRYKLLELGIQIQYHPFLRRDPDCGLRVREIATLTHVSGIGADPKDKADGISIDTARMEWRRWVSLRGLLAV